MTTIAVNKDAMACDLQFTNLNTGYKFKGKTKIHKFRAHPDTYGACDFMVGFCGQASEMIIIASFFENPDAFDKAPKANCSGVVLTAKKDIFIFDDYRKWLIVNLPFTAVGSGAAYALGALDNGASPKEAVKIAMKHDAYTGYGAKELSW